MKLNWGATMPFPEKFLHNKRDTMKLLAKHIINRRIYLDVPEKVLRAYRILYDIEIDEFDYYMYKPKDTLREIEAKIVVYLNSSPNQTS